MAESGSCLGEGCSTMFCVIILKIYDYSIRSGKWVSDNRQNILLGFAQRTILFLSIAV